MEVSMTRGLPTPSFDVVIKTPLDLKETVTWLQGLDLEQMTVVISGGIYTFQTARERLFFAFGLEKCVELISSGEIDADRL